jgi:trimeric autotransporter adhesin
MGTFKNLTCVFFATLILPLQVGAQRQVAPSPAMVPRLVNFSGRALSAQGKPISGVAGVAFAIYKDQSGGSPLWIETQSVQADAKGNYVAQLGASRPSGLPLDLFSSGEARWLGVRINGGEEQARVLLLSVPAADACDREWL